MFEGERARGRVLAAQDRPGQRDRAVSSTGGTSELSNHDHAGNVEAEIRDNLNIFGDKTTFPTVANSFLSICNVQSIYSIYTLHTV